MPHFVESVKQRGADFIREDEDGLPNIFRLLERIQNYTPEKPRKREEDLDKKKIAVIRNATCGSELLEGFRTLYNDGYADFELGEGRHVPLTDSH